jgi:hypothetical protein
MQPIRQWLLETMNNNNNQCAQDDHDDDDTLELLETNQTSLLFKKQWIKHFSK